MQKKKKKLFNINFVMVQLNLSLSQQNIFRIFNYITRN